MSQIRPSYPPAEAAPPVTPDEWDEMVSGNGRIRPGWRALVGVLHTLPEGALAERAVSAARQHDDIAVAYRLTETRPAGEAQPFDIVPLLIEDGEWTAIAAGLAQRARLLGAILGDLYGNRQLIASGLLPPGVVYGNPNFLRPCAGLAPAGGTHLHAYAADLVRQPDGAWRVLADRLRAPSGIGFSLLNRGILARTMPEIFRSYAVRRIEPFFEAWQARLAALAPPSDRPPRVVVLTPGPFNAGFFEHVYLARQLGAVLVEGADLTARDGRVFIKTLGALQPVDVVLRFMDDDFCDPLELRSNSVLGVAGLLQAARAGTVAVVNALGASVIEAPALRPFLPRLAETLLGESLTLPSVETHWLGAPGALDALAGRLDEFSMRPAFALRRDETSSAEERGIADAVRRRPDRFVAEARVAGSRIPIWTPGGLQPRPLTLRVFLFHEGAGYRVMPGGYVQVAQPREGPVISLAGNFTSKDVCVLAGDAEEKAAAEPRQPAIVSAELQPGGEELRSRTADDLFWLGRYTERLDNIARVMRSAVLRVAVDRFGQGQRAEIERLMRLLIEAKIAAPRVSEIMHGRGGLLFAIGEASASGGTIDGIFRAIHRIAQSLRDRLSHDMWRIVLRLMREARARVESHEQDADKIIAALDHLIATVAAFNGMASENMTRGSGWRFLDLGRRLERGLYGTSVLQEVLTGRVDGEGPLGLALELCDSAITYRSRWLGALRPSAVFALLLSDEINPRAVAFQLRMVLVHLRALATTFGRVRHSPDLGLAETALIGIRQLPVSTLDATPGGMQQLSFGFDQTRRDIADVLAMTHRDLLGLSETITRVYFSHTRIPQAIGQARALG